MLPIHDLAMALTITRLSFIGLEAPPTFLAPSLLRPIAPRTRTSQFSTATSKCARNRDMSKNRGVSGLRRTGLKRPVEMMKEPLPRPVLDPERRSKVPVDENHGLWDFFNKDRKALTSPEEMCAHGSSLGRLRTMDMANLIFRSSLVGRGVAP